jgi:hypothetical protein
MDSRFPAPLHIAWIVRIEAAGAGLIFGWLAIE